MQEMTFLRPQIFKIIQGWRLDSLDYNTIIKYKIRTLDQRGAF
jgi:hypothetical protein